MTRGVDKIQQIGLAISGFVIKGYTLRLNGDAPLFLKIHGIEYLSGHFTIRQAATHLDNAVSKR